MHSLGIAYAEGLGTERNEEAAASWFAKAAMQGYVDFRPSTWRCSMNAVAVWSKIRN